MNNMDSSSDSEIEEIIKKLKAERDELLRQNLDLKRENENLKLNLSKNDFIDVNEIDDLKYKLIKKERQFKALTFLSLHIVLICDNDGFIKQDCSDWSEFTGQDKEAVTNSRVNDFIHPDDLERVHLLCSQSVKNKTIFSTEYRLRKANGLYADVTCKSIPILSAEGEIDEWLCIIQDISEEKIAKEKQKFLLEATLLLNSSLDYQSSLKSLVNLAVPYFADYAYIELTDQKSVFRRIMPDLNNTELEQIYSVVRLPISREPRLISEIKDEDILEIANDDIEVEVLRYLELKGCIIVPLICQSRTVGTINFLTSKSGRDYFANDLIFAQEISSRISLSLDNAYLFELAKHEKLKAENKVVEFEFLANTIPQLIWTSDADGKFVYYNKKWSDYTGIPLEDIYKSGWLSVVCDEDLPLCEEKWLSVLKTNNDFEIEARLKNTTDNQYHWFLGRAKPLLDEENKVIKWFGTFTDIDHKKKIEQEKKQLLINEQIARNEADFERFKLNSLFMNAPAAICVYYGPEHIYELVNPRYRDILGENNYVGRTIRESLTDLGNHNLTELLDQVFTTGEAYIDPEMMILLDKNSNGNFEEFYFNVVLQPIKSFNDETERIALFGFDITEQIKSRKRAEILTQQLESSNMALQQFAYVASHDLQEPLRTITSYIKIIQRKMAGKLNEEELELFNYIIDGSSRMKALINDILNYSKISYKNKEFKNTDLNVIVKNILHDFRSLIEVNNATILYDHLPELRVEPTLITQLFQNLISNAIKYKGDNSPVVKISSSFSNNQWMFSISDNGIGIASEYFERIFIIFQRLHAIGEYEGTGIGLAICKKIIDLHNGRIWLESEEGKGTTFYFTIPV